MDKEHKIDDKEYDLDNGLSISLMDEICKRYSERHGTQENTSFNVDEFLNDRFSGTHPHTSLRESINMLVNEGFLLQNENNIDLTKKGIAYCRKKTNGFIY